MTLYVKTGYKRGRPHKGTMRPDNPNAKYQRDRRDPAIVGPELAAERVAARSASSMAWQAKHPERVKEQHRDYYRRSKAIKAAPNFQPTVDVAAERAADTEVRVAT